MITSKKIILLLVLFFIPFYSFSKTNENEKITDIIIISNVTNNVEQIINFRVLVDGKEDNRKFELTLTRDKKGTIIYTLFYTEITCNGRGLLTKEQQKHVTEEVIKKISQK